MLFAGGMGRCSPTVRGGSDLWSGRLAGGAICGRSGLQVERLAGGAALGSGVVAGDVETSPLPRQAETNELARVAGEGCTVFPQTLTNPAHSPPFPSFGGVPEGRGGLEGWPKAGVVPPPAPTGDGATDRAPTKAAPVIPFLLFSQPFYAKNETAI